MFKGDPNKVTIFGESSGSASVHYLVLSRKSRVLFHKAIMQSGVALNDWNGPEVPFGDFCAQGIAKLAGYKANNENQALEVLRNAPVEQIVFVNNTRSGECGPCVEKFSERAFLTKNPIDLLHSGEYNEVRKLLYSWDRC